MHTLLGIDLGTTGVKAALFSADDGHVLSSAFVDYPLVHPQPGWAEQDPDEWWSSLVAAFREMMSKSSIAPNEIAGLSLDST
ncbi:MAG TPA: xylulokinase, partial [Ktedonobacter sp.]|nr:xylulokinase [Ktedonobacter sp.]